MAEQITYDPTELNQWGQNLKTTGLNIQQLINQISSALQSMVWTAEVKEKFLKVIMQYQNDMRDLSMAFDQFASATIEGCKVFVEADQAREQKIQAAEKPTFRSGAGATR